MPPALAERLLSLVLGRNEWAEAILGDLHEEHRRLSRSSPTRADVWYCGEALRLATR